MGKLIRLLAKLVAKEIERKGEPAWRHSADYRFVAIGKHEFHLGEEAAIIFRELYKAQRKGIASLSRKQLSDAIYEGAEPPLRIPTICANNWGTLFRNSHRGFYRIASYRELEGAAEEPPLAFATLSMA